MTVTCRAVFGRLRRFATTPVRPGRRGWSAAIAGFLLPVSAFFAVGAMAQSNAVAIAPAIGIAPTHAPTAASPVPAYVCSFTVPEATEVAGVRAPQRDVRMALAPDLAVERGLQIRTILAARAIRAKFPEIAGIGGVRPDGLRWHPDGLALDVMIRDYNSPAGVAFGDRIAAYVRANADRFGLHHLIWRQVLYLPNGTVRKMGDRGSEDANHLTHVHIATTGGGFPTGREVYFTTISGEPTISRAR